MKEERKEVLPYLMSQKGGDKSPSNLFASEDYKSRMKGDYDVQTRL